MATRNLFAMFNRGRGCRVPDPDQGSPSATSVVGHGTRREGLTELTAAPSSSCFLSSRSTHRPSTPRRHARTTSGSPLCALDQQTGQAPSATIQVHLQARLHSASDGSGPERLSTTPALETVCPSFPVTDSDAVPVPPTHRQANFGPVLTGTVYELSPRSRLLEPLRDSQNEIQTTMEPEHAVSNSEIWSANSSQHPRNAVAEHRFVGYGEVDPEKHVKRKDRTEDKNRKKSMSRLHGACFPCRKAKRQCEGEQVCNRCRNLGLACVRTCNSCWRSKTPCDDRASCKSCQRLRIDCHRLSATRHLPAPDDLQPPSLQPEPTLSTAPINQHNLWQTTSGIDAPMAWRQGFGVERGSQRSGKRHCSRSSEHAIQDVAQEGYEVLADLRREQSPIFMDSDDALVGSQPYSQQATDVDLNRTLTKDSTIVVAGEDRLSVRNKGWNDSESCSGLTEQSYFDDAYHTSDIASHLEVDSLSLGWSMRGDED